ncbi:hypothetical protein ROHU_009828 [Labeo rohita]|uniref:DDE Tnp4 domain-containing protein n=1 Tax=Labeo rohita TaxID=84645 RepID=A0A498M6B3_LABRO|nr:hypothetical protein ROHU_009828 [Labeo rohita]
MEEDECINEFRVRKCDLPILVDVLRNPNEIICDQSSVVGGVEALCMLLKRLTYPCRYSDMMQRFGHRQVPVLCMATNSMLDYIYAEHHQRITQWNDNILNPAALETYADSIHQMGAPLENCFGFIDGTVRPIARPGITQRILYNGHKRIHSLKYQAVAIPNGLIAHLYGPVEGSNSTENRGEDDNEQGDKMGDYTSGDEQQEKISVSSFMQCLTGQGHIPISSTQREKFKIHVGFNHDCQLQYGQQRLCRPLVNTCSCTVTLPTQHLGNYKEFLCIMRQAVFADVDERQDDLDAPD